MAEKTALFGAGSFSKVHAKDLADLGYLGCIVDIDPAKEEIAKKHGVPFINRDAIRLGKEENEFRSAIKTDNWDIVTNTPIRFPLTALGVGYGKDVFVEEPPTEKAREIKYITENYPDTKIGVNYIEMAHPVVQANKEDMDFEPGYSFNRRSKDLRGVSERRIGGGLGSRITLEDLMHDLSEVDLFRKYVSGSSFAEEPPEVSNAKIQTWYELPEKENGNPKYPFSTDVRAEFALLFPDGMKSEIEGGFADPEIRQYIVTDEDGNRAEYGNTLTRPEINPMAARVEGKRNVDYLLEKIKGQYITDKEKQDEVLKRANAETLEEKMNRYVTEGKWKDGEPKYGWVPLFAMLENFHESDSKEDLICSLDQALGYQDTAEQVYHKAGKPGAMVYKVLE